MFWMGTPLCQDTLRIVSEYYGPTKVPDLRKVRRLYEDVKKRKEQKDAEDVERAVRTAFGLLMERMADWIRTDFGKGRTCTDVDLPGMHVPNYDSTGRCVTGVPRIRDSISEDYTKQLVKLLEKECGCAVDSDYNTTITFFWLQNEYNETSDS